MPTAADVNRRAWRPVNPVAQDCPANTAMHEQASPATTAAVEGTSVSAMPTAPSAAASQKAASVPNRCTAAPTKGVSTVGARKTTNTRPTCIAERPKGPSIRWRDPKVKETTCWNSSAAPTKHVASIRQSRRWAPAPRNPESSEPDGVKRDSRGRHSQVAIRTTTSSAEAKTKVRRQLPKASSTEPERRRPAKPPNAVPAT